MLRFRPFSTVHTNATERFQIDAFSMKTLSVCVGGRPKRIEMYAFSNENVLVWTGPNSGTTTTNLTKVQPNREVPRYWHWRPYLDLVERITAKLSLSQCLYPRVSRCGRDSHGRAQGLQGLCLNSQSKTRSCKCTRYNLPQFKFRVKM